VLYLGGLAPTAPEPALIARRQALALEEARWARLLGPPEAAGLPSQLSVSPS